MQDEVGEQQAALVAGQGLLQALARPLDLEPAAETDAGRHQAAVSCTRVNTLGGAARRLGHSLSPISVSAAGSHEQADQRDVDEDRGGEPDAGHLDHRIGVGGEAHEDRDHDRAGGRDDLARAGRGGRDRRAVAGVPAPLLTHARDQEHVVVGREAEQDREHEQRHVRDDGLLLDAQQRRAGGRLERERHDAVGGGDRRQVEDRRHQRDPPRAERDQQQQQRQADDGGGEHRDA